MSLFNNIVFRIVEKNDSIELFNIWTDHEVTKYTMINNINSNEDCINRIERQLKWLKNDSIGPYVIIRNNNIIGYCGGTKEENNEYEIFYHLSKDNWNKGIGTIVVNELLNIGFKSKKANKIRAKVVIDNIVSYKVLEKNGMKRIRKEEKIFEKNGKKYDMYIYEIDKNSLS